MVRWISTPPDERDGRSVEVSDEYAPLLREDLTSVELDGELVVFNPADNGVHQLDPIATLIWPFLDGSGRLAELVDDLAEAFDESRERVRSDLVHLLVRLSDANLLAEPVSDPALSAVEFRLGAELTERGYLIDPPAP